jgi:hypothetical protein
MTLVRKAARLHRSGLEAPEIAARLLVSLQTAQQLIEQVVGCDPAEEPSAADAGEKAEAEPAAAAPAARTCVYIEGDGPFVDRDPFCGKPALRGMPYCAEHAARCYRSGRRSPAPHEAMPAE